MTMRRQRPGLGTRGVVDTAGTVTIGTTDYLTAVPPVETNHSAAAGALPPNTLLLWGWPVILAVTGIPRRTLERELSAGRFPRPVRHVGRRPYWRPEDVRRWAQGGQP
jgi:predicted DNA-binding transcriptional regulator AlpA